MDDLSQMAISSALAGDWETAIKINKQILSTENENIDVLNRLARAYAETGDLQKAQRYAEKVLKLEPNNSIAQKSLAKWQLTKKAGLNTKRVLSPQAFLEEPGKTKTVSLINLGDKQTIMSLSCGDCLELALHPHSISLSTQEGEYIGKLPDDISHQLKKLMEFGNQYLCLVKGADSKEVKVFIRETHRGESIKHISSFSPEKIQYVAFASPDLVHGKEPIAQESDI